jgi:hypothetical protein
MDTATAKKPVSAAPAMTAKADVKTDGPKAVATAAMPEKPVTFVKRESTPAPASAPAKEWKIEKKAAPVISEEPVVADTKDEAVPATSKIAFVPGNMPINGEVSAVKPDGGSYFLQIGSYKEKAQAEKGWKILQTQNVDLLGEIDPVINEVDLGADKGGLFYRLQIGGFSDKVKTMRLCGTLRDRNFECFMPMAPKAVTPKKPLPTLAPGQRMAKDGKTNAPGANDTNLIADFKDGFDAL